MLQLCSDTRPLAILIYAKEDYNGAFENNQIHALIQKGYRVVYFEAKTEDAIKEALAIANPDQNEILLVLAGHGSQSSVNFGATENYSAEALKIDFSDEADMSDLAPYIGDGSVVVFESCSTGKGKAAEENIVNLLRKSLAEVENLSVFGPTIPTAVNSYTYDSKGRVINVTYFGGSPAYSAQ